MAAIGNAVANAIGVRVPFLPLTPDRVVTALKGGSNATV
jgi:CO/xanthine dehydrogenase Mo-binding subunit